MCIKISKEAQPLKHHWYKTRNVFYHWSSKVLFFTPTLKGNSFYTENWKETEASLLQTHPHILSSPESKEDISAQFSQSIYYPLTSCSYFASPEKQHFYIWFPDVNARRGRDFPPLLFLAPQRGFPSFHLVIIRTKIYQKMENLKLMPLFLQVFVSSKTQSSSPHS